MKKLIISLAVISLFLFSCGNSANNKLKEQNKTVTQKENQQNEEMPSIELNSGEKWKVDANMLLYIRNMESAVFNFSQNEQKNYSTLTEKLETNIDSLTSNCTMTGQAHDELHIWLLPYISLVTELSEAKEETRAAKQFQLIESSFITFNQYFQ